AAPGPDPRLAMSGRARSLRARDSAADLGCLPQVPQTSNANEGPVGAANHGRRVSGTVRAIDRSVRPGGAARVPVRSAPAAMGGGREVGRLPRRREASFLRSPVPETSRTGSPSPLLTPYRKQLDRSP